MYWILSDIHGMYDPLKLLIQRIEYLHERTGKNINRFIFLGDYIDYGPSAKEVVDLLLSLNYPKTFLMGNHEDLMLQFMNNSRLFQSFGNLWFKGTGGQATVNSFRTGNYLSLFEGNGFSPDQFQLEGKYREFFYSLVYAHKEMIGGTDFIFVHAGINHEIDFKKQTEPLLFEEFHEYLNKKQLWIEDTHIWTRDEPLKKIENTVIIHGHTPTVGLDFKYKNLHDYDLDSGFPFCKFEENPLNHPHFEKNYFDWEVMSPWKEASLGDLISINIDTGAAIGKRLTALGIPSDQKPIKTLEVLQIDTGVGYRELNGAVSHHRIDLIS